MLRTGIMGFWLNSERSIYLLMHSCAVDRRLLYASFALDCASTNDPAEVTNFQRVCQLRYILNEVASFCCV